MVDDGVRCASYLPTDGYLDPSQLTYALAEGAREGGVQIFTHTRVTGIDVFATRRVRGVQTEWGPIEAEIVVNAGGMFAAEIGRLAGVRVPIIPFAHEYLVTQPFRERGPAARSSTCRRCATPTCSSTSARRAAGLVMGGYERHSAPWALDEHLLDAIPADFNGRLLEEDWPRFEEIARNSRQARPGDGGRQGHAADQRTRGVHARQRVLPRRDRRARASSSPPGSARTASPAPAGSASVMAEWILEGEPSIDVWQMDIRRFGPHYRSPSYTLKRTREVYETYYDIRYPGHERQAGRPLRVSSAYEWHREHGAAFGEKSGWERVNWYESNARRRRSSAAPARLGRDALVARDRRRARARRASAPACSTSPRSPSSRSPGPERRELLERLCDNRVARERRRRSPTRRCSTAAAGSSATSPSRGWPTRTASGSSPAPRSATTTRAGSAATCPTTARCALTDVTSRWACFALWGPRARDDPRAADA